jgi:hypothetical protein
MRHRVRRAGALVIACLLAVPVAGVPQTVSSGAGLAGDWVGWATLTNDWPGHPCRYEGSKDETSVRLELSPEEGRLRGSVAIDLPAAEGSGCPPLRKRLLVTEVVLAESAVSLTDSGGHGWDLALRGNGRALRGIMAWQQGGADEPLAEGFAFSDGEKPRSRLRGEVQLRKATVPTDSEEVAAETEGTAAGGTPTTASQTTSGGTHVKNLGAILGATAVGLGALYGVNQLGQGETEEGVVTCSPRRCVVGAPGEPCFCEGNVVSGQDCGATETGIPEGGNCDFPTYPCEALLSCNSALSPTGDTVSICEDRIGRCPFS